MPGQQQAPLVALAAVGLLAYGYWLYTKEGHVATWKKLALGTLRALVVALIFVVLLEPRLAVDIERSYNKLERTKSMVNVALQGSKLREESERLAGNQQQQGLILISDVRHASAANYKAKADLLQANLAYLLAWAELQRTMGRTPGAQRQ